MDASAAQAGSDAAPVVTVVQQNLLHGIACPTDSNRCDLPGRVRLFARQLAAARCPPVVAVQEANRTTAKALASALRGVCHGRYRLVWDNDAAQDRELVVTTDKVLGSERIRLAGPLRTALWVRLSTAAGVVDLVTTHLASSSDDRPCDPSTCRPPCRASDSLGTCQARQAATFLFRKLGSRSVGVLAGDLNAHPEEPTIAALRDQALVDTHDAAKLPECDPSSGSQCTSGRVDDAMTDMRDASSRQNERIDYVFTTGKKRNCSVVAPTGILLPRGGPVAADGLVFPADHSGVEATLRCPTTKADRDAAKTAALHARTTTTVGSRPVPALTRRQIADAFTLLFGGTEPDPERRLTALEQAAAFHDSFVARMRSLGSVADHTSVRIDAMSAAGRDAVDVTFSILLNGAVVLDALPGRAVHRNGRWLVSARTYCQIATLGTTEIPVPCR